MAMVKKSISITDQQDQWIKKQLESGHYGNESEVIRDLIRERQLRSEEDAERIAEIRAALIDGERSGISTLSVDEIWEKAREAH